MPAASDFEQLAAYLEKRTDFIESQRVAQSLLDTIEGLADFPELDQQLHKYLGFRRRPCLGYSIIYEVFEDDQVVEITRILGQRQSLSRHLRP